MNVCWSPTDLTPGLQCWKSYIQTQLTREINYVQNHTIQRIIKKMREATKYVNNPFHHTLSTQNLFFLQHISFDSLLGKTVLYSILKRILFVKEIIY